MDFAAQRILHSNSCRQLLSFLIAETKGTMETLNLKPMEQAKIACAKKLFSNLSSAAVVFFYKFLLIFREFKANLTVT